MKKINNNNNSHSDTESDSLRYRNCLAGALTVRKIRHSAVESWYYQIRKRKRNIQNQEEKTSKSLKQSLLFFKKRTTPSVFFSGLDIVFSVTGREQLTPDLGVALPMQMRIFLPDYTCLACGCVFILGCFNPSWCGTDFAFSFTAWAGSRYYSLQLLHLANITDNYSWAA